MIKSPFSKVFAPRVVRPIIGEPKFVSSVEVVQAEQVDIPRPDFPKFIDEYQAAHLIRYNGYSIVEWDAEKQEWTFLPGNIELDTRRKAQQVTDAMRTSFPEWEILEFIESSRHTPPFQVSWIITKK